MRDGDPADPRISPIFADEDALRQVCPAHVVIAGYDPLADEGAAYAQRLREVGVPVTVARYDGQMHGFLTMGADDPHRGGGHERGDRAPAHAHSGRRPSPSGAAGTEGA